jgi:esterase
MNLHYQISGEGSPLIILHGLFGTLENWGSQISTLSQQHQVIAVDLRNHGQSPHSDAMDYPLMAQDVVYLMDSLELKAADIIGHSMGGKVAMQIALNYPDHVNKLIIVDISPVSYSAHHQSIFQGLFNIDLDTLKSRSSADKQLSLSVEEPGIRAFLLKNLYKKPDGAFAWRPNLPALHDQYSQISNAPTGTKFSGETLFIKGMNSDYILAAHQTSIQNLFSKASFKMIEGAGHWPHAEKANIFSSIILKFLA